MTDQRFDVLRGQLRGGELELQRVAQRHVEAANFADVRVRLKSFEMRTELLRSG